jgi:hypothetical protein
VPTLANYKVADFTGTTTTASPEDQLASMIGEPATAASYYKVKYLQNQIFQTWVGTSTATTVIPNDWPSGWLDISTSSCTTSNTITCTGSGNTTTANGIWEMDSWQNHTHSKVRWTPTVHHSPPRTAEEIAAAAARSEIRRQEQIKARAKRTRFKDAANVRARRLLMQMLNEDQQKELDDKNHFHLTVHSRDGSMKVYRVDYGFQGNVKLIGSDGKPDRSYCIHSDSRLPYEDQMLAQKLLLEANEPEFLRIANESIVRRRAA